MGAMGTTLATVGTVAGTLFFLWPLGIWWEVRKCEKPKYTVLKTIGTTTRWFRTVPAVEVRRYSPYLVAEYEAHGPNMREAVSSGFRAIAGFIFGKNVAVGATGAEKVSMTSPVTMEMPSASSQPISMTSPVTATEAGEGVYKVTFIMPSKYTKETLPKPLNEAIKVREVPGRTLAALAWNGRSPREPQVEERREELLRLLREAGLHPTGPLHLWQYHPPFAPSWQRVNEVLTELEEGESLVAGQEAAPTATAK